MKRQTVVALLSAVLMVGTLGCGGSRTNDPGRSSGGTSLADEYRNAKKIKDPSDRSIAMTKVGVKFSKEDARKAARLAFDAAFDAAPLVRGTTEERLAPYKALTTGLYRAKNEDDCKKAYQLAEPIAAEFEKTSEKSGYLTFVAFYKHFGGDTDGATADLVAAEKLVDTMTDVQIKAGALCDIAYRYSKIGGADESKRIIDSVVARTEKIEKPGEQAPILINIAATQRKMKQTKQADETLAKALAVASSIELTKATRLLRGGLMFTVAEAYESQGNKAKTREVLNQIEKEVREDPEGEYLMTKIDDLRARLRKK